MVNITWLGESDNRVYKHIGLSLASSADGEFAVSPMHGIAGL